MFLQNIAKLAEHSGQMCRCIMSLCVAQALSCRYIGSKSWIYVLYHGNVLVFVWDIAWNNVMQFFGHVKSGKSLPDPICYPKFSNKKVLEFQRTLLIELVK